MISSFNTIDVIYCIHAYMVHEGYGDTETLHSYYTLYTEVQALTNHAKKIAYYSILLCSEFCLLFQYICMQNSPYYARLCY